VKNAFNKVVSSYVSAYRHIRCYVVGLANENIASGKTSLQGRINLMGTMLYIGGGFLGGHNFVNEILK
jgi:hypothetical protein